MANLDLVGVHGGVGNEHLGVLDALGLVDANLLVKEEALLQVRVLELSTQLLDDLDGLEVARFLAGDEGGIAKISTDIRTNAGPIEWGRNK